MVGLEWYSCCRLKKIFSTCFGQLCAHYHENLLYLCDTGIFHSVWVAVWSHSNQQTRQPPIQSEKFQYRIDTVSSPDDGHEVQINIPRSSVHLPVPVAARSKA